MLALLAGPAAVCRAQHPLGEEFQIDANERDTPGYADLARTGATGFAVVWSDQPTPNSAPFRVFGRVYDSSGAAQAERFQVNDANLPTEHHSAVGADAQGRLVVVFSAYLSSQPGDLATAVYGRRHDSDGTALGPPFEVYEGAFQDTLPRVAVEPDGDFVVVWSSAYAYRSGYQILARRYASDGSARGSEFHVGGATTQQSIYPSVASDAEGNFVVAWESQAQGELYTADVFGRRYSSSGTPLGAEFRIDEATTGWQHKAVVSTAADGAFVVVWTDGQPYQGYYGQEVDDNIRARLYDSAGLPRTSEFLVNASTSGDQLDADLAHFGDGTFVVVWRTAGNGPTNDDIVSRLYDSAGHPLAGEVRTDSTPDLSQRIPAVAAASEAHFVVSWRNVQIYGGYSTLVGRMYDRTPALPSSSVPAHPSGAGSGLLIAALLGSILSGRCRRRPPAGG